MKLCNKCQIEKPFDQFHKDRSKVDNLCTICKVCKIENAKVWAVKNSDRVKISQQKIYDRNKQDPTWVLARQEYGKLWRKTNSSKHASKEAKRRATKLRATPIWLTDQQKAHIERTYKLRAMMSSITGEEYHVDHVVPLKSDVVCGLHVPWNLRVIPAKDNLKKGNKF